MIFFLCPTKLLSNILRGCWFDFKRDQFIRGDFDRTSSKPRAISAQLKICIVAVVSWSLLRTYSKLHTTSDLICEYYAVRFGVWACKVIQHLIGLMDARNQTFVSTRTGLRIAWLFYELELRISMIQSHWVTNHWFVNFVIYELSFDLQLLHFVITKFTNR